MLRDPWQVIEGDAMLFVALSEAASRGELLLVEGGMCRFHRRKDGTVTIREILVLPALRRQGIGRRLLQDIRERNPGSALIAKCPAHYESNAFWKALGFRQLPRDTYWILDPD